MNADFWKGKRVFLTGHTGFKGGWLAIWLQCAGAKVFGYSTPPPTDPNLFSMAGVAVFCDGHATGDIRDPVALRTALAAARPDIVFHLAAQPLVRYSYAEPVETYSVNVLGTVQLLDALRNCPGVRAIVNVTTDKCYENQEWAWGYRENEPMGGHDPYSNSKACSELVTSAYRKSFLAQKNVGLASARAGNVIGGGDWASDRLIPDVLRAMDNGKSIEIRHPGATRPWQHVLEPLSGYLSLAERLFERPEDYATAWNFGPSDEDARSVAWILNHLQEEFPHLKWERSEGEQVHEANYLKLDSTKARTELGWRQRWDLQTALLKTFQWHTNWKEGADMRTVCVRQIEDYERSGRASAE